MERIPAGSTTVASRQSDLRKNNVEPAAGAAEEAVKKAVSVLRRGGMVLYPTDTLYGLGVDAFSDFAVAKIYACKGRSEDKPIHAIVESAEAAAKIGDMNTAAQKLAREFWPGALTLILRYTGSAHEGITRHMKTIGLRVPDHPFCLALAREFKKPYTTTSANRSGMASEHTVDKIVSQLEDAAGYIDLVIDSGELAESLPSTVVDLSDGEPV
ncbi:MAG: threonylcarbamoyl-AMP synthase, partial [Patescibacteria group bacterium]|nr:threonylcarbamoyl-AMP synthase [Patescibacteria group bacterium]